MQPGICPYCGRKLTSTRGEFGPKGRFRSLRRGGYIVRQHCVQCRRFIGYKRPEKRK